MYGIQDSPIDQKISLVHESFPHTSSASGTATKPIRVSRAQSSQNKKQEPIHIPRMSVWSVLRWQRVGPGFKCKHEHQDEQWWTKIGATKETSLLRTWGTCPCCTNPKDGESVKGAGQCTWWYQKISTFMKNQIPSRQSGSSVLLSTNNTKPLTYGCEEWPWSNWSILLRFHPMLTILGQTPLFLYEPSMSSWHHYDITLTSLLHYDLISTYDIIPKNTINTRR